MDYYFNTLIVTFVDFNICFINLKGQQRRKLKHFHYVAWPDIDVPKETKTLMAFLKLVRQDLPTRGGPVVVHCRLALMLKSYELPAY
jgi:protein tyrosine phosphatase